MTVEELAAELAATRKYAHVCTATRERVAAWALARYSGRDAGKAARRKLHQVYGAYVAGMDFDAIARAVDMMEESGVSREACATVLRQHASTAERLPGMETFYARIFECTGMPGSILDVACGLHPFALPWMGLPPGTRYHAVDIDTRLMGLLSRFFTAAEIDGHAICDDVLVHPPQEKIDVALVFKTIPCLEQQEKGAAARLLSSINARQAVVTWPLQSLGGKSKGMREHYTQEAERLAETLAIPVQPLNLPNELGFVYTLNER